MWKILIILSGLCSFSLSAQTIVSGLDDVLRQAENTGLWRAGFRMMKEDVSYAGMQKLYGIILHRTKQEKFVVLSAMPNWFSSRVKVFLHENKYPPADLKLRNIWWNWSIVNFKMNGLKEIIQRSPDGVILILDNSEASLEFAQMAKREFGERIQKIYLRQTLEKKVPEGMIPFYTAFDLGLHELKSGRLSRRDLEQVLIDLLSETSDEKLIPSYAHCPQDFDPCQDQIIANCQKLSYRIQQICRTRSSKENEHGQSNP